MFKAILIAFVLVVSIFMGVAALQPNEFRVERSLKIKASADKIFPYLNDVRKMNEWSPWAKLDPQMKQTYKGPESGVGASASWTGNSKVGEGRQTIIESQTNQLVRTRLEFFKPFKGVNTADFALKTEGEQTVVTWSMYGPNSFMAKMMGLVMNCNKMVGAEFERGLNDLKTKLENKQTV